MIVFPNCKINLGLHVTGKREDGYHDLETVFFPVPLHDALEILENGRDESRFILSGGDIPGRPEDNLCLKAYRVLSEEFSLPHVDIILHKHIPVGAGLGGGSSDGAFTLSLLNRMCSTGLDEKRLTALAGKLGSDCPFFIVNRPSFARGKGELLEPLPLDLRNLVLVIVKPPIHVDTAYAFRHVKPAARDLCLKEVVGLPIGNWKELLINDFEAPIFEKFPQVGAIKAKLYAAGALYAAMSGSGSAVYGFFREAPHMPEKFDGCFMWTGKL